MYLVDFTRKEKTNSHVAVSLPARVKFLMSKMYESQNTSLVFSIEDNKNKNINVARIPSI